MALNTPCTYVQEIHVIGGGHDQGPTGGAVVYINGVGSGAAGGLVMCMWILCAKGEEPSGELLT